MHARAKAMNECTEVGTQARFGPPQAFPYVVAEAL